MDFLVSLEFELDFFPRIAEAIILDSLGILGSHIYGR